MSTAAPVILGKSCTPSRTAGARLMRKLEWSAFAPLERERAPIDLRQRCDGRLNFLKIKLGRASEADGFDPWWN